jgi:ribA/ribD-fused uncharacterized protein
MSAKHEKKQDNLIEFNSTDSKTSHSGTIGSNIDFYDSINNKYKVFSNFMNYPVTIDGISWPTNEHYYQAMKFGNSNSEVHKEYRDIIRVVSTPYKAKLMANQRIAYNSGNYMVNSMDRRLLNDIIKEYKTNGLKIRSDWDDCKIEVMVTVTRAKYDQYPELKEILLSTGKATIREASPTDYYWGIGKNRTGENMLGKVLMKVRDEYVSSV